MTEASKYKLRGVSSGKEELFRILGHLDAGLFPASAVKIMPDVMGGSPLHCNILHSDGSGTKSALAYMYWKQTGDISVWRGIVRDAITMNVDDMLCAGISDHILISLIINRNLRLIPAEVISELIFGAEEYLEELRDMGLNIHLAGGETADVGDLVRTLVVDVSASARMLREEVIHGDKLAGGDVIVGLASFGKTSYEKNHNSGLGCNGLTSARHDVFGTELAKQFPESYDAEMPESLAFTGNMSLTEKVRLENVYDEDGNECFVDVGQMLLSPCRTYYPVLREMLKSQRRNIHAMVHCTGGGQTKILRHVDSLRIIKDAMFPIPQVFKLIKNQSNTSWKEMFSVFNMGHRLEIYTSAEQAQSFIDISKSFGLEARVIGYVENASTSSLLIKNLYGEFNYQ